MYNNPTTSLALLCDERGIIVECLKDGFGLSDQFPRGKQFLSCFTSDNFAKALELTVQIKSGQYLPSCKIDFKDSNDIKSLCFSGKMIEDKLLIIASESKEYIRGIIKKEFEESTEIKTNHSPGNRSLRINTRENLNQIFDELTRLNSEIVRYKDEISRKNAELEELNKIKNQFLGMAAHDLRNPLGNIRSYSEFILDESGNLTEEQIEFTQNINSLSSFMLELVNDLLDISNIESGNLRLEYRTTNLVDVIKKNINFNHLLAEKKKIQIDFTCDTDNLQIRIDQRKINQVLTNLISNAIKFSHPDKKVSIVLSSENNNAIVSIIDEGQGIASHELSHLFEAFHRTSTQTTGGERSTGLGLVIVRKIVEAHKGTIDVKSELGEGSAFTFTLPLMDQLSIF